MGSVRLTANARTLGSRQGDALQRMTGSVDGFNDFSVTSGVLGRANPVPGESAQAGSGVRYHELNFDSARVTRSSTETRPLNTAYYPRIHA